MPSHRRTLALITAALPRPSCIPSTAQAYVGPGAGFAVVGSLAVVFITFFLAMGSLISWPFRTVRRAIRSRHLRGPAEIKRAIVLGLDGLDPVLVTALHGRGPAAQLQEAGGRGYVQAASDLVPVDVARGVVDVRHRRGRVAAQHLRLPRARREDVLPDTLFDTHQQSRKERQAGQVHASRSASRPSGSCGRARRSGRCSTTATCRVTCCAFPSRSRPRR